MWARAMLTCQTCVPFLWIECWSEAIIYDKNVVEIQIVRNIVTMLWHDIGPWLCMTICWYKPWAELLCQNKSVAQLMQIQFGVGMCFIIFVIDTIAYANDDMSIWAISCLELPT